MCINMLASRVMIETRQKLPQRMLQILFGLFSEISHDAWMEMIKTHKVIIGGSSVAVSQLTGFSRRRPQSTSTVYGNRRGFLRVFFF